MKALQNHRKNESEKNQNRIVRRNADLLESFGVSAEEATNLDLLIEDRGWYLMKKEKENWYL